MSTDFARLTALLALLFLLAPVSHAAVFTVGAILQAGGNGTYEIGAGSTSGSPVNTTDDNPYWQSGLDQQFDIAYSRATNTLTVTLYQNGSTTAFNSVSYTPAGPALAINSTWIIPASSFFVQALSGSSLLSIINVSNLTLTGLNGALNVISPIQQTTMQATQFLGNSSTVTQSQDVVFRGDSTGSWQLSGLITLTGFFGFPTGNQLAFGITATATPEPAGGLLSITGLVLGFGFLRWRKGTDYAPALQRERQ
jgi:hypothetical protein